MATGLQSWSKTASSNSNADSNVNWAEGMTAGAVNNSARAEMASAAMWRDDNAGMITTGGTSTAFTATSNQTLTLTDGASITLQMSATNGASPTLNVDSSGAKAIQRASGTAVASGTLLSGAIYRFVYRTSPDAWIAHGLFNTREVGEVVNYAGSSAPSLWLLCYGQAISRTTYSSLFAVISTTYGVGDGSTTFNVPDLRGRVVAGQDDMGGTSADRLTNVSGSLDGDTLGATGGGETVTLTASHLPDHNVTITDPGHLHSVSAPVSNVAAGTTGTASAAISSTNTATNTTGITAAFGTTARGGAQTAHNNVQPTIVLNKIIYAGV
jgi:microcystin-dependent protein